MIMISNQ